MDLEVWIDEYGCIYWFDWETNCSVKWFSDIFFKEYYLGMGEYNGNWMVLE